ncbi:hypothetical protein PoB_007065000 [Plakobranchus ocellatus]|uniref:Uncharacterized protein n=1 Tax=Plakobranchus ocellatus TaxID=259542 RepID=A0AAV4DJG8_9GAST|nr:hypothetical protein PoB_007065000 [Plakobranchus ocellatus]
MEATTPGPQGVNFGVIWSIFDGIFSEGLDNLVGDNSSGGSKEQLQMARNLGKVINERSVDPRLGMYWQFDMADTSTVTNNLYSDFGSDTSNNDTRGVFKPFPNGGEGLVSPLEKLGINFNGAAESLFSFYQNRNSYANYSYGMEDANNSSGLQDDGEGHGWDNLWRGIPLGIVLAFLCLLTTAGNIMVLHAVRTEKRLQTVSTVVWLEEGGRQIEVEEKLSGF